MPEEAAGAKEDPAAPMSLAETKTDTALTWGPFGALIVAVFEAAGQGLEP